MNRAVIPGISLACIAALGVLGAGLGYRFELWSLGTGFTALRWFAYAGAAAAVTSLVGLALALRRRRWRALVTAAVGLVMGATVAVVPYSHLRTARSVPPIHDISTDTVDPPTFLAVLPLRSGAPNAAEYGGPAIAAQQLAAYPDLQPARLALAPTEAFARALAAANALDWQVVQAVPEEGRLEATATTMWFGFHDDVVVRVRAEDGGSRVDVRSVSRVGKNDAGTNARRIRRFLAHLAP